MMFDKQAGRLLRKDDWTANELAQELAAMLKAGVPLVNSGGVTFKSDMTNAPIVVQRSGAGNKVISVVDENGAEVGSITI